MLSSFGVVGGIALLIGGGTLLVRGASAIASGFGVSPMVVGLTIVGFGTSTPELVVNLAGASQGATAIAFGNVLGSNISNLALVLGTAALVRPIALQGDVVRRELPLLLLATTMMTVMALDGPLEGTRAALGRTDAIVLMLMFCIFIYITALDLLRMRRSDALLDEIQQSPIIAASEAAHARWFVIGAGFVLLLVGGELTVRSGVELAGTLGVSTTIIGLFVVAIGTSMPELVTSIIAAFRNEPDLALGNVIGSNIFNSLVVLPAAALVTPIPVPAGGVGDLVLSWLLAAVLIPIFWFGKASLGRGAGTALLVVFVGYAVVRILM